MDFNINNESFANAYKCLKNANSLLDAGLGNFCDLDSSALKLIGKNDVSNTDRLNTSYNDCYELKKKMYNTIKSLATFDVESADYFSDILGDVSFVNGDWDGIVLTARMGFNGEGPSGSETWYDLNMSKVVENMEKLYGYTDVEYNVRGDGVKVLSGVTPDGERFENLVMVAADVYHEAANPNGTFKRGQIVPTSLGTGIVVDACGKSISDRKYKGTVHFDIATAWHTGEYMAAAYGKETRLVSNEHFEQVVPGQSDKIDLDIHNDVNVYNKTTNVNENLVEVLSVESDGFSKDDVVINSAINNSHIQPKNNTLIAHRGYSPGGITDNSRESYIEAGKSGFWGCEADVRFDSNGNLVCSHNTVKNNECPLSFDEYLDICKEYGMTAIIDLKYEKGVGPADPDLSPAILRTIEEKGMLDTSILQTNNPTDIPYIRENSVDARIWYLKDAISDKDLQLIQDNGVECVNILTSDNNTYRINRLIENGVDVCVWNVQTETSKQNLLNMGAKYVMTDNVLGVTPYQDGDIDVNNM